MKNFTFFLSIFLLIAFTSCEKTATSALDLNGEYETTIEITTTVKNGNATISSDKVTEIFIVEITGERFARTKKGNTTESFCAGTVSQKGNSVSLKIDQCEGTSIAGIYQYNETIQTLSKSSSTIESEGHTGGNCPADRSGRTECDITSTQKIFKLEKI